jgi:hypothetical protein
MGRRKIVTLLCALVVLASAGPALARIKLAALPVRQRVEIQLDNDQGTLVEEERIVPLLKSTPQRGNNQIDFSWSNTRIDKDSIQFRPLGILEDGKVRPIGKTKVGDEQVDEVAVINVAYPPGENALVWEIYSSESVAVKVRVSYLISNLARTFSYRALADKDEKFLSLRNNMKLHNFSGEDFGVAGVWAGFGERLEKPIGQQEELEVVMHRFAKVPIEKTFTFNWYENGPLNAEKPLASRIQMHYKLTNDEKHGLGLFPLQPGKVRIFILDPRGSETFLGEDWAQLTPLDGEMELYLGEARDIICTRIIELNERHRVRGNLHDQELIIKYEVENYKDKAATLTIVEDMNRLAQEYFGRLHGDVEWVLGPRTSKKLEVDTKTGTITELSVDLPARPEDPDAEVEKTVVQFHFTIKNLW